jgi:hypothetical protein
MIDPVGLKKILNHVKETKDLPKGMKLALALYLTNEDSYVYPHLVDFTEDGPMLEGYYLTEKGKKALEIVAE